MDGEIHTNGIQSFWALLKPGYVDTYNKMNVKHMNPYVQEFSGRYNPRTPDQRAGCLATKRLHYADLVEA